MVQLVATYERPSGLNVRRSPSTKAEVVRVMRCGEQAVVEEVRDGWARLSDGFAQVAFLVLRLAEADGDAPEAVGKATEPVAEHEADATPDEAEALRKMTNPQLYELAEKSGIKVRHGANKAELIAAILADA